MKGLVMVDFVKRMEMALINIVICSECREQVQESLARWRYVL